jgi:hypothetical protein
MIIDRNSPLLRLPPQLNRRQALFLEGIRYSIQMADLSHFRLRENLFKLAVNCPNNSDHLGFISALQDAWSIVDSVHRLRGLLNHAPGFKQKAPGQKLFILKTAEVEELRNIVQHLNEKIDKTVIPQNVPLMGVLTWLAVINPEQKLSKSCALVAGSMYDTQDHKFVNPAGQTISLPVDLITLTASGYSSCLSKIMKYVEALTRELEMQIESQFKDLPSAGADMIICAVIKEVDEQFLKEYIEGRA